MCWGGDVNVRLKLNTPLLLRWSWGGVGWGGDVNVRLQLNTPRMLRWACVGVEMWTFGWSWTRLCCYADHGVGWGGDVNVRLQLNTPRMLRWACVGVEMWTFGWSWTRLCCYADHGVGWGGDVNVRLQLNTPRMLRWACGGVEMWTFGWSWTRLCCYADHVVGWRCERSVEVEHASAATLIMGWGGDVNVRLQLNTPRMLRWACGGAEMWTFGWSWTRLCCYAEHVVGWRCERSVEVEHASAATLIMWWGGDVNVRLKLNTPLLLRWSWGGVGWGC